MEIYGSGTNPNRVSQVNSSATAINAGQTFTGEAEDVSSYNAVVFSVKTDQDGVLYAEFSTDATNWDSSIPYFVAASQNEVHKLTVTRKYFRIRFTNSSASNQTAFRLQVLFGSYNQLTSPSNSIIQSDADAVISRPLDFNLMVAEGLYQNRNNTIKDGTVAGISTGAVTIDITNEGGVYAGFPRGAVEEGQIVVAGADTGTVYYSYMASDTATDYTITTKAIAGAGTYSLGHNIWRCNFAYFVSSSATAFNAGNITIRNAVTTANIFCVIPTGYSQSYCSAYTVPYGSSIFLDRINGSLRGSNSGSLDGYFWYRSYNESPRLRFPFELQFGSLYFDDIDYLTRIPERVDFIPRIIRSSANNLEAKISYRFIKVKNTI